MNLKEVDIQYISVKFYDLLSACQIIILLFVAAITGNDFGENGAQHIGHSLQVR